jgi:hypothetical protein
MAPIRDLPLALIPLFGVGISGASHIIAFHLLWTERGTSPAGSLAAARPAPAIVQTRPSTGAQEKTA